MLTSRWRKSGYSACNGNCLEARWRKSSRSTANGHCLEAAWHRSSRSMGNGNCTEAALRGGAVLVRDSRDPDGPRLSFSPAAWDAFLESVRSDPVPVSWVVCPHGCSHRGTHMGVCMTCGCPASTVIGPLPR